MLSNGLDIKHVVKIKRKALRDEVRRILRQVLERLPLRDLEIIKESLGKVYSRKSSGKQRYIAATRRVGDKFDIVICRDLFDKLSEKAKIGVLAHELRHIYLLSTWSVAEELLGSEFQIDEDLVFEWSFGEEVEALRKEFEVLTGSKLPRGYMIFEPATCDDVRVDALRCSLCGVEMEEGYVAIPEGDSAISALCDIVGDWSEEGPFFCFDCKEKMKRKLKSYGIIVEDEACI